MNTPITFEVSKLLKEKKFKEQSLNFYTKPNSKMFGIDEHYRNYPIKNIPKKLYTVGVHTVLNIENVYFAPTIIEVVMWLHENHKIWINIDKFHNCFNIVHIKKYDDFEDSNSLLELEGLDFADFLTPKEAYEAAIEYTLKNLI